RIDKHDAPNERKIAQDSTAGTRTPHAKSQLAADLGAQALSQLKLGPCGGGWQLLTPSIANCGYFLELGQRRGKRFVGGISICSQALCRYHTVEATVAQVISHQEQAGGAPYLELVVCRSSTHPDTVVAAWRPVEGAGW